MKIERPPHRTLKRLFAALTVALIAIGTIGATPALAQCVGGEGGPCVPEPCDFVTSGGFVLFPEIVNAKDANFGAHGGCKNDGFWGHVNYVDHNNGYHVDSISITAYLTDSPSSINRDICGQATTNIPGHATVFFRVRLIDNGEPGVADTFGIALNDGVSDFYVVSSRLLGGGQHGGGNIELHKDNPSTTPPNPIPIDAPACNGVSAP